MNTTRSILMAFTIVVSQQSTIAVNEFSPDLMLKPKVTQGFLLPANQEAGPAYEKIGDTSGVSVVFYRGFKSDTPAPLRIENATLVEALDQLSAQTGNFWFPWNANTVVVAPDNPIVRRSIQPLLTKAIYFDSSFTQNNMNDLVNRLRTNFQLRGLYQSADAGALVVHDIPARIAIAEREVGLVSYAAAPPRKSAAPLYYPDGHTDFMFTSENGRIRKLVPANRAHLEGVLADSVSMDMNGPAQAVFENLAAQAGLNVVFDNRLKTLPTARFRVNRVDLLDALDLLALQSGTIWQPVSPSTIFVMEDSEQNRRDMEPQIVKILYLTNYDTSGALRDRQSSETRRNGMLNVLRTAVALRNIYVSAKTNALLVRDTPLRVSVAEKIITDLDEGSVRAPAVTLTTPTSSFLAQNGWVLGSARDSRNKLDVKLRSNTNIRLNDTPRVAYATLADMAGLKISVDSRIADEPAAPLNLNSVDILDALDLLSLQTRHFWQAVDEHTIRVMPSTTAARQEFETREMRVFSVAGGTKEEANELLSVLRTALELREASVDEGGQIVVRDTPDMLALVQTAISTLGNPATFLK